MELKTYKILLIISVIVIVGLLAVIAFLLLRHSRQPSKLLPSQALYGTKGTNQAGKIGTILRSQLSPQTRDAYRLKSTVAPVRDVQNLPDSFDWRISNPEAMSDVLNQEQCGSCWAFAITSALSDRTRLADSQNGVSNHLFDEVPLKGLRIKNQISPFLLAGCDFCDLSSHDKTFLANANQIRRDGQCNQECDGGAIEYGLIFAQQNGLVSIGCEPPVKVGTYRCDDISDLITRNVAGDPNHHCHIFKFGPSTLISLYEDQDLSNNPEKLAQNENAIMAEIMNNGPVITGFMVHENFSDFFSQNSGGVYTSTNGTKDEGGHAVVIVGWGVTTNGTKYWICRNSWGTSWNSVDGGYFKFLKGQNLCQFESGVYASQPDVAWLQYVDSYEQRGLPVPSLR